ncbi:MAG: hypothetical protein AAGJ37_00710 [Pseudomonadota bacterium]
MRLSVTLLNTDYKEMCLWFNEIAKPCFTEQSNRVVFDVVLEKDALLTLRRSDHSVIAEHRLELNVLVSADFRKRTRMPWSIF